MLCIYIDRVGIQSQHDDDDKDHAAAGIKKGAWY